MELSRQVVDTITKTFPDTGAAWVEQYPLYLEALLSRWDLTIEGRAEGGWPTNVVYFVRDGQGRALVLKMGHPHDEAETERITLHAARERDVPVVRLLDSDPGYGLLLERVEPGYPLRSKIRDPESIRSALALHSQFPQPIANTKFEGLPSYKSWLSKAFEIYREGTPADPPFLRFLNQAETLFEKIDDGNPHLLHGDLHHENILKSSDGWTIIDPKGVVGPKVMELGRFFHNFVWDELDGESEDAVTNTRLQEILSARFSLGADVLDYDPETIAQVTFVDLTLAMTWFLNSGNMQNEVAKRGLAVLRALSLML